MPPRAQAGRRPRDGEDIEPGEYRSAGEAGSNPVGCSYAWKSGTGSDADIVDNNIVEGQTRVTHNDGDVFESTSREQWVRGRLKLRWRHDRRDPDAS